MPTSAIVTLESPAELERAYAVLHELRTTLSWDSFCDLYEAARIADQYRLVGVECDGQLLAVMGYRVLTDFVRGRHLYVDDLVTTQSARSQGWGAKLLQFAEIEARRLNCPTLRLCTGVENAGGKRFYEREGWRLRSYAFVKDAYSSK